MTFFVNWSAAAPTAAGLVVLLGLTWLLRGGRAVARMCGVVGIADVAVGGIAMIAGGVIILGVVCWCFRSLRGSGQRRKAGRP
jgi:hypothetical protein